MTSVDHPPPQIRRSSYNAHRALEETECFRREYGPFFYKRHDYVCGLSADGPSGPVHILMRDGKPCDEWVTI